MSALSDLFETPKVTQSSYAGTKWDKRTKLRNPVYLDLLISNPRLQSAGCYVTLAAQFASADSAVSMFVNKGLLAYSVKGEHSESMRVYAFRIVGIDDAFYALTEQGNIEHFVRMQGWMLENNYSPVMLQRALASDEHSYSTLNTAMSALSVEMHHLSERFGRDVVNSYVTAGATTPAEVESYILNDVDIALVGSLIGGTP